LPRHRTYMKVSLATRVVRVWQRSRHEPADVRHSRADLRRTADPAEHAPRPRRVERNLLILRALLVVVGRHMVQHPLTREYLHQVDHSARSKSLCCHQNIVHGSPRHFHGTGLRRLLLARFGHQLAGSAWRDS
jgi:hypothetical protein